MVGGMAGKVSGRAPPLLIHAVLLTKDHPRHPLLNLGTGGVQSCRLRGYRNRNRKKNRVT